MNQIPKKIDDLMAWLAGRFPSFRPGSEQMVGYTEELGSFSREEIFEAVRAAVKASRNPDFPPSAPAIAACIGGRSVRVPVLRTDLQGGLCLDRAGGNYVRVGWVEIELKPGETPPEHLTDVQARKLKPKREQQPELPESLRRALGSPLRIVGGDRGAAQ